MGTLTARSGQLLRLTHEQPGLTRARAAQLLGLSTGAATDLVARLHAARLVQEEAAEQGGTRGRPTRRLAAHPAGPLVLAGVITHESWRLAVVELGGGVLGSTGGAHRGGDGGGDGAVVLDAVRGAAGALAARHDGRVRGLGLAVPGLVHGGHLLQAPILGWHDVDLRAAAPRGIEVVAGNDASLAAVGEARRGAAVGTALALHLHLDAGLGGAVTTGGVLLGGARGLAGEFGHLPFGDPAVPCACGARGCWGTSLDGPAMARALGEDAPRDPVSYARRVLARAAAGEGAAQRATREVGRALGRGIAGLVNALDPDLLTLGALTADLLALVPDDVHAACSAGLMGFRRGTPPPLLRAALGEDGPLIGAAEQVWSRLWEDL